MFFLLLFNGCNKIPFVMITALAASLRRVRQTTVRSKARRDFCEIIWELRPITPTECGSVQKRHK